MKTTLLQNGRNPRCEARLTPKARLVNGAIWSVMLILSLVQQGQAEKAGTPPPTAPEGAAAAPIPWNELGAKATAQHTGDGLAVTATPDGARLRCAFQRLDGEVTREGLWLLSTAEESKGERFRVVAAALGRTTGSAVAVPVAGKVVVAEEVARFIRPGLVEEYRVSVDGVRQDFVVESPPAGEGSLRVELELTGVRAEKSGLGARLVLDGSGRQINYHRLRVTDASGKELPAHMEVVSASRLSLLVDDAAANYPVRIDPTFTDADWTSMGGIPGADFYVYAAVMDDEGNLYVGGDFKTIGDVAASRIAKWDGSTWSTLGSGMSSSVYALAIAGNDLYAGGKFTTAGGVVANRIAKWDGNTWSALGSGMNNTVYALVGSGNELYAGGAFSMSGDTNANRIAKWDGESWSALGLGFNDEVRALVMSGSDLYAGGLFNTAGGLSANYLAKWDGTNWSALGAGFGNGSNDRVLALVVSGGDLYAGGAFTEAGGREAYSVAKWNGSNWSGLGSGVSGVVYSLAVSGDNLYAGGGFAVLGGYPIISANSIAKWDGNAWTDLAGGMAGGNLAYYSGVQVFALAARSHDLYAGGNFTLAGGVGAEHIARWNGSSWSALGSGVGGGSYPSVNAFAVAGTILYVGGSFRTVGGIAANYIAKWDGSSWTSVGSGMNSAVYALMVSGNDLYAGGHFTQAGGIVTPGIAKWNGSTWTALGAGMTGGIELPSPYRKGAVYALAMSDGALYAGGNFHLAGGNSATNVAKWDGSSWSALDTGMDGPVWALAASGSFLYAGGDFTAAGGVGANRVAKWDGMSWSPLGSGMNNSVRALAVLDSDLYAGGRFWSAGGRDIGGIAVWDGSTWSSLGRDRLNYWVSALAVVGDALYVGGNFTRVGGITTSRIAKWDGASWMPLGSGIEDTIPNYDEEVRALALLGANLYVGGVFTRAGGKVSGYLASAFLRSLTEPPTVLTQPASQLVLAGGNATFGVVVKGGVPLGYQWMKNGAPLNNMGNISGADTATLVLGNVQVNDAGNYSVVVTNAYGSVTSSVAMLSFSAPPATPPVAISPSYPLATNAGQREFALSSAFDGTNFLIGIRGNANHPDTVGAQLLSPAGTKVGAFINTGRLMDGSLDGPRVAFGGGQHLVVWTDAASQHPASSNDVYGQFISSAGELVGGVFPIAEAMGSQYARGAAFDGTDYFVIWASTDGLRGRRVSQAGGLWGTEMVFTTRNVKEAAAVAYGGGQYLVVWVEGDDGKYAAKGRLASPAGQLSEVLALSQNDSHLYNPISVAYGEDRFLAVWHHNEGETADWNLRGRMVLPNGTMVGGELFLVDGAIDEFAWANNIAFDGAYFLLSWTQANGAPTVTDSIVWGQYWSARGWAQGSPFIVDSTIRSKLGVGLSGANGRILAVINTGIASAAADVCARTISRRPFVQLSPVGSHSITITFTGVLQWSTDLRTWMDYEPQPTSPWLHQMGEGSHFFRAREEMQPDGP